MKKFAAVIAVIMCALCALSFSAGCKNQAVKINVSDKVAEKPFF